MVASPHAHRFDLPHGGHAVFHALSLDVAYVGERLAPLFRPVWDRPVPFDEPPGGLSTRPVEAVVGLPDRAFPVDDDPCAPAVQCLRDLHLLQAPDDPHDADWLETLRRMTRDTPIRMLTLVPTTRCNFGCLYCHEVAGDGVPAATMDTAEADAALSWWGGLARRRAGKKDLLIYGGEPLLAPAVTRHVIQRVADAPASTWNGQLDVILVTNGAVVDAAWARFLATHDTFVIVSCDGVGEVNDRARVTRGGRGTWEHVVRAVDLLRGAGVRTAISITVSRHNLDSVEASLLGILERLAPVDVGLNSCLHPPPGERRNAHAAPPLEATRRMIDAYVAARERGLYVEQFNRRVRPFALRTHRVKDCPACGGRLVIQPGARVSFCDSFSFTDQYTYPMEDLDLDGHPDHAAWSALSPVNWAGCSECPAIGLCGGGCRYDGAMATGRLDGLDPDRCTQDRQILAWILDDLGRRVGAAAVGAHDVLVPTEEDRRALLGPLTLDPTTVPLGNANRYGERVGREEDA